MTLAYNAPPTKPSKPYMTDEYEPTDANLWEKVLDVARGHRREFTRNERVIHAPNHGRGFHHWPNPRGVAWAVKQYNGYNGGWRRKKPVEGVGDRNVEARLLAQGRQSGILATRVASEDHVHAEHLRAAGYVQLSRVQGEWHYWATTRTGRQLVLASLGDDLLRRMRALLGHFDVVVAKETGEWILKNFRVDSPKTPKGAKELKDRLSKLVWVLRHRASSSEDPELEKTRAEVEELWKELEPHLPKIIAGFTDEGGTVVPKEVTLDGVTFVNEIGVGEAVVERYAKRLSAIFKTIHGWRAKALAGSLKVVLASPRNFSGTVSGKYRRSEDALYVRATPTILKRDGGYASFEYIVIHELGHRYERLHPPSTDFEYPQWRTSHYSYSDEEAFAELFAIGHFKLTGSWDRSILERFEDAMQKV